jgi:hypothetical protein
LGFLKKLVEGKKVFSIDILYYVRIVILYKTLSQPSPIEKREGGRRRRTDAEE